MQRRSARHRRLRLVTEMRAGLASRLRGRLKLNEIALRRGARAALVIPPAFFLARFLFGEAQALIFIVFGCFALLVMADFGGPRRARALAYLATVTAGAVLVALGTLASATAISGAAVMLVVGFGLGFAAVFGGYTAIARHGVLPDSLTLLFLQYTLTDR